MVAALVGVALGGLWAGEASANVQPFGNLECAARTDCGGFVDPLPPLPRR